MNAQYWWDMKVHVQNRVLGQHEQAVRVSEHFAVTFALSKNPALTSLIAN